MPLVVYLDPYFLGDPLFVPGLARDLAARGSGVLLVHGSGERGERALEALGDVPTSDGGVWRTRGLEGEQAVERAARELNREIHHELNEAGVATIRVAGSDRGLLRPVGGALEVGNAAWLSQSLAQGVTAVLVSLVRVGGRALEVDPATAAGRLSAALGLEAVALTTGPVEETALEAAPLPDRDAVRRLAKGAGYVAAGPRVLLRSASDTEFTRLAP